MRFDLYITYGDGTVHRALSGPYDTRQNTKRTVRTVVLGDPTMSQADAVRIADTVAEARLGETVSHPMTRVRFRTEEVS